MYKFISRSIISILVFVLIACDNPTDVKVKHMVMIKFKDPVSQKQIQEFTMEFTSLKNKIPVIMVFDYGINSNPKKFNNGFTHFYAMTFNDHAALTEYLEHQEHIKFAGYAEKTGIIKEVFVLDYPPVGVR